MNRSMVEHRSAKMSTREANANQPSKIGLHFSVSEQTFEKEITRPNQEGKKAPEFKYMSKKRREDLSK